MLCFSDIIVKLTITRILIVTQLDYQKAVSFGVITFFVGLIITLGLGTTLIAGIVSYLILNKSAQFIKHKAHSNKSHLFGLGIFMLIVVLFFCGVIAIVFSMLKSNTHNEGLISLISTLNGILDNLKVNYPTIANKLPSSFEQLKNSLFHLVGEYSQEIGMIGVHTVKTLIHLLIGMIIGVMVAFYTLTHSSEPTSFEAELIQRATHFTQSFENIIFAQIKISAINTVITALYLVVILPMFSIQLPFKYTIVLITFFAGVIPVVGNIISNTTIVCLSLLVSMTVAIASLVYLLVIHKLEYFLNAKIIGDKINAKPWELLTIMLLGESMLGLIGVVLAPVIYATIKKELQLTGWLSSTK